MKFTKFGPKRDDHMLSWNSQTVPIYTFSHLLQNQFFITINIMDQEGIVRNIALNFSEICVYVSLSCDFLGQL